MHIFVRLVCNYHERFLFSLFLPCLVFQFFQDFNINFNNFNIFLLGFSQKKNMTTATKQAGWLAEEASQKKMILASTKSQEDQNSTQSRSACSTAFWLLTLMLVIISLTFIIMEFVQVAGLLLLYVSNSNNTNKLYINNKNTMSSICWWTTLKHLFFSLRRDQKTQQRSTKPRHNNFQTTSNRGIQTYLVITKPKQYSIKIKCYKRQEEKKSLGMHAHLSTRMPASQAASPINQPGLCSQPPSTFYSSTRWDCRFLPRLLDSNLCIVCPIVGYGRVCMAGSQLGHFLLLLLLSLSLLLLLFYATTFFSISNLVFLFFCFCSFFLKSNHFVCVSFLMEFPATGATRWCFCYYFFLQIEKK